MLVLQLIYKFEVFQNKRSGGKMETWATSDKSSLWTDCSELPHPSGLSDCPNTGLSAGWRHVLLRSRVFPFWLYQRRSFECKNGCRFLAPSQAPLVWILVFFTSQPREQCPFDPGLQRLWKNSSAGPRLGPPAASRLEGSSPGEEVCSCLCLIKGPLEPAGDWCNAFCWARSRRHC